MESIPNPIILQNFTTESGALYNSLPLSFALFGLPLHSAPVVLVNHALTGNAQVTGENGWWNDLIGEGKTIDTTKYSVLAFNVPGNGSDSFSIENYQDFTARDVARIFLKGIETLQIEELYAIIGGSVGGGIAWEMMALAPNITQHLIPIATDWKSTDWMIANCFLQEQILNNSSKPIEDARIHAMLCYRSPESFKEKFQRTINQDLLIFNIESWLAHHGDKLQKRYQLTSYKLMNQLLKTIDITRNGEDFKTLMLKTKADIHIIAIDSDLFFTPKENQETFQELKKFKDNVFYSEINSVHGHDAFLIEYKQLDNLLAAIF
ncbi:alpha/beta fold hydrolase [Flavobacterium chungangense]|uniref:Homoserine acetyltransferase n=1 Tax=Flavobacterium chungangense TaxID=554283 RepID=A0A6V6YU98_9FLAO|nr:alpha/beta fold hydrolase [Flavobacterium chungangense]CAD0003055.1 homoserine acetyltransferase [Flavobacterium chungangense]